MSTIVNLSYGSFHFGGGGLLKTEHLPQLITAFGAPDKAAGHRTVGRCAISRVHLETLGNLIVKHYHRGGFLARLVSRTYFRIGKRRCQSEFEQMVMARSLGIQTPEPIGFAYKGFCFYRAWLITREVEQAVPLAQLSRTSPERTEAAMRALNRQLDLLVAKRLRHADFHPGNILVDNRDRVCILDFDKAHAYSGPQESLRKAYIKRWCRAVCKHKLPPKLCELIRHEDDIQRFE